MIPRRNWLIDSGQNKSRTQNTTKFVGEGLAPPAIFKVEIRRFFGGFLIFMRLFSRFKLLCRTQYGDVRSKRLLHLTDSAFTSSYVKYFRIKCRANKVQNAECRMQSAELDNDTARN